jgi:hypothetical protein
MNITKITLLLYALIVLMGTINCSRELNQPDNVASSIEITYQAGPEISAGGEVLAWIDNTTKSCLSFPPDFDIKVFIQQGEDWVEVPNLVTYLDEEAHVLEPKGSLLSKTLVYIWPDVSNVVIKEPVDSYASITGNLCDDESYFLEKKIPFVIVP